MKEDVNWSKLLMIKILYYFMKFINLRKQDKL